jgi:hypothetical protein
LPACTHYHVARTDTFSVGITIGLKHENAESILRKAIKTYQKDPFKSDIKTAVDQFKWKRKSSIGFKNTPLQMDVTRNELQGLVLQLKPPFKIVLGKSSDGNVMAFARGNRISGYISPLQLEVIEHIK